MKRISRIGLFALASCLVVGECGAANGRRPVSGVVGVFNSSRTNYSSSRRSSGFGPRYTPRRGVGMGVSGRGIGTGLSGRGVGMGRSGMGIGMGATGTGIGMGMSGMGIGTGMSGMGIGTGMSGMGIGAGFGGGGIGSGGRGPRRAGSVGASRGPRRTSRSAATRRSGSGPLPTGRGTR